MTVKEFKQFNEAGIEEMREVGRIIEERYEAKAKVEITYEDYGQGIVWYMLIIKAEGSAYGFQAFNPREYDEMMFGNWTEADTERYINRMEHLLGKKKGEN